MAISCSQDTLGDGEELYAALGELPDVELIAGKWSRTKRLKDRTTTISKGVGLLTPASIMPWNSARRSLVADAPASMKLSSSWQPHVQARVQVDIRQVLPLLGCQGFCAPPHASWLNIEIEIGVLRSQCLDRRIDSKQRLVSKLDAWERQSNASPARLYLAR